MDTAKWPEHWQYEVFGEKMLKQLAEPREGNVVLCIPRGCTDPELLKYRDVATWGLQGLRLYDSGLTAGSLIGVTKCAIRDSTDTFTLTLLEDTTKLVSAAWAPGDGEGGLVSGSVADDTWYYVYFVMNDVTSVVDVAISPSATDPGLANHTYFRKVGMFRTNGYSLITPFVSLGGEYRWRDAVIERALAAFGTTDRITIPTSLPPSSRCTVLIGVTCPSTSDHYSWVASANKPDNPASSTNHLFYLRVSQDRDSLFLPLATDASGNIYARSSTTTLELEIISYGWYDDR